MKKRRYPGKNDNVIRYGKYNPTDKEIEARNWCINNRIIIWPETKLANSWKIEIRINGKSYKSPEEYRRDVVWQKMYEFYGYYYKKYRNENSI
jgi:hypothetical protein|tara:strand:+ start:35 stop:313 length:279 start_codon:yes stop_codon:yes gene_type:complete